MSEILWVGVGFNPAEDGGDFNEQHDVINSIGIDIEVKGGTRKPVPLPSGAFTDEYVMPHVGTVVDIFDALGGRIGFGIRVGSIAEGKLKVAGTEMWLRAEGIVLPVSVHAWSPASGVREEVSA